MFCGCAAVDLELSKQGFYQPLSAQKGAIIMSRETLETLNTQTLIGFTAKRGTRGTTAPRTRATSRTTTRGRFLLSMCAGAVRLGARRAEVSATIMTADGVRAFHDPTRRGLSARHGRGPGGVFSRSYQIHGYEEWLLRNVADLLDDDLQGRFRVARRRCPGVGAAGD